MGEPAPGTGTPDHDPADTEGTTPAANGAKPHAANGAKNANGQAPARPGATGPLSGAAPAAPKDGPAPDRTANGSLNGAASKDAPGPAPASGSAAVSGSVPPSGPRTGASSRRPPAVTRDTARPEGGGRAAPGDAPAPARQWPLLTVIGLAALGLLIVAVDPFAQAFRVGTILVGAALLTGAVFRRVLPSVGMLAVRSRFTDMLTYGLLGTVIVLLALMAQPRPWLEIPFLEDAVRFTVR
ncbi:DUF3017 domain-containing protein [Streptomyces formicae]|uniref:DUF3017 domain-containing protein n=1 Tax=Streptomyces formicae TaxID=1616117 RepID=A0ABY3WE59_9ACTN|nr:DUF3017 domain-containing protein [Streptomyces formicae]UNM10849.1 DUF3017 domain-containing protein [Streptomyces formicae]